MHSKTIFTVFQISLFLFGFWATSAQAAETVYSPFNQSNGLDNVNPFARSAAMGSAFVGISDDASALFTNPAGLAYLGRGQAWLNTHFWLADTFQETALFGVPLSPHGGGIALAGSYFSYGTLQGRDETGSLGANYNPYRLSLKAGGGD